MLKKKNIAMVMAAATVATTVAPVFAGVVEQTVSGAKANEIAKEIDEKLATKYSDPDENGYKDDKEPDFNDNGEKITDEVLNSVYEITAEMDGKTYLITSGESFLDLVEEARLNDDEMKLTITDKGHEKVGTQIISEKKTKNRYVEDMASAQEKGYTTMEGYGVIKGISEVDDNEWMITLASGKTLKVEVGDLQLNFEKPLDENGNKIKDLTNESSKNVKESVASFELYEDDDKETIEIPSKVVEKIKVVPSTEECNIDTLFDGQILTEKGSNLVDLVTNAKKNDTGGTEKVKVDGKYYITNKIDKLDVVGEITKQNGEYTFEVNYLSKLATSNKVAERVSFTVTGKNQSDLSKLRKMLDEGLDSHNVSTVSGDDRFATSVEVSKKYTTDKDAKAIVLVGEDAVVDGLAVAPLAKGLNAPILLTKKDSIPAVVKDEIDRIVNEEKMDLDTIYIAGGKDVVSSKVVDELGKYGITVKRLAGETRCETSVKIAKELKTENIDNTDDKNVYVVGADGEADAMSIAPKAAEKGAPILVVPANKLDNDVETYLDDNKDDIDKITVIGGETKVSTNVMKDVKDTAEATSSKRISGATRNETNAKVIESYDGEIKNLIVSKDGMNKASELVDALTAAPYAAKLEAPIVLSTDGLTTRQEDAIDKRAPKDSKEVQVYQVGRGIATKVIAKLVDILDLD